MRIKNLLLPISVLALTGCNIVDVPDLIFSETDTFSVDLVVNSVTGVDNEYPGSILIGSSYLGKGFEEVKVPDNLLIGSLFTITYTGSIYIQETYPSTMVLTSGKVISYSFEQPTVHHVSKEEFSSMNAYAVYADFIVTDKEGHCKYLSDYDGDEYYVTENIKMTRQYCGDCHDDANCAPCMVYFSGVYAFDPTI